MKHLIDEPSPFDTLEVWQKFLKDVRRIKPRTVEVNEVIENAEQIINEKSNGNV
jgi:hypothetical protein